MEFGMEKLIIGSVKRHGKNRTTKPRRNQNTQRKGNVHVLGNIGR